MRLFLVFLAIPILEIALFIQVGGLIGLWPTLGLVVLSALAGATLLRSQGMSTLRRLRARIEAGADPTGPLADGALLLIAAMLLLTPGFFTDAVGLILLTPAARAALIRRAAGRLRAQSVVFSGRAEARRPGAGPDSDVLEGEYHVLDDVPPSQRGASGWTRPTS